MFVCMFLYECVCVSIGAAKYATTADDYAGSNFSIFTASPLTFGPSINIRTAAKIIGRLKKPSISLRMDLT